MKHQISTIPAKTALIDNIASFHKDKIGRELAHANEVLICTAFLKSSGLKHIRTSLNRALKRGARITFIAGTDFYLTEPQALWDIFHLLSENKKQNKLYICNQARSTFHPKVYFWRSSGTATVLVGSANLTDGGLRANHELSILSIDSSASTLARQVRGYFSKLLKQTKRIKEAQWLTLSKYEQEYKVYRQRMATAEAVAKKEVETLSPLDQELLVKYLTKYRSDKAQTNEWRRKKANYNRARVLISNLARRQIRSSQGFLKLYEPLVGSRNESSLWHSGGLFRHKSMIASNYSKFLVMLRDILRSLNMDTILLIEKAVKKAQPIDGLGLNVITEILNTMKPKKYAVLNKNSISSLKLLGFSASIPRNKLMFSPDKYVQFNETTKEIARDCKFDDLSQVDHFLNFIYWHYVKKDSGS